MNKLNLNQEQINDSRLLAKKISDQVFDFTSQYSTLSVERSVLRMIGIDGVNSIGEPLPNQMVDEIKEQGDITLGVSLYLASALVYYHLSLSDFIKGYLEGTCSLTNIPLVTIKEAKEVLKGYLNKTFDIISHQKEIRQNHQFEKDHADYYVIVATGNIYEDVIQAKAAARAGADIIAVIRSTGQSLLDYVPYGATTEGFGGTYATQENFRIMRKALDEVGNELHRYIKLVNYASGLCMPEIATMAAIERLDILLNDSMYGIIFRDINMQRTLIDQHFSRMINAYANIIINTGEDNYLTTSDAFTEAHTVLASQFINEAFAYKAHLKPELMGLGHAYEIDPMIENSFLYEIAQAEMARTIFPQAPLKYMPPTKHITGNIFRAYEQNTLFNIATHFTGQSIHLLGMMTEAIHTPFLSDRYYAIENAKMVNQAMKSIREELVFKEDGLVRNRANKIVSEAHRLLESIEKDGLFLSLEKGVFAGTKRQFDGGKGLTGVFKKGTNYFNLVADALEEYFHEN